MAVQKIGISARFETAEFNAGLSIYLKGMLNAEHATDRAAHAISRAGDLISIGFGAAVGTATVRQLEIIIDTLKRIGQEALNTVRFFERLEFSLTSLGAIELVNEGQFADVNAAWETATEEARGYLLVMQDLAIFSPFKTSDIADANRLLTVYGFLREEALGLTERLVDFASAAGLSPEIIQRLALALGQIRAEGRLLARDALQLSQAGVPVLQILSDFTGKTIEELQEMQRKSQISAKVALQAFIEFFDQFEGAGKRVSGTLNGLISSLEDLRELGLGALFKGAFESVTPILQQMVDIFSSTDFRAGITVVGELIGVHLRNATESALVGLKSLVAIVQNLSPTFIQGALAFTVVAGALTALTAAAGLTYVAINLLVNPFTVAIAVAGLFAAAYVTNFARVGDATNALIGGVGRMVADISSKLGTLVSEFATVATAISDALADTAAAASAWGAAIVENLAAGILSAVGIVYSAIGSLGAIFTLLMAPGSAPRFLPDLAVWGAGAADAYLEGWNQGDFSILDEAADTIRHVISNLFREDQMVDINVAALVSGGTEAFAAAIEDIRNVGHVTEATFARIRAAAGPAGDALVALAERYERIMAAANISARALEGVNHLLDLTGMFTVEDFGALSSFGGQIDAFLQQLSAIGEIDPIDLPGLVIGARGLLAAAIDEIHRLGAVSQATMDNIRATAGPAADAILGFVGVYDQVTDAAFATQIAQDALATAQINSQRAQDELNATIQRYDDLLAPLRNSLEEVTEAQQQVSEQREIRQLQRIIANQATTNLQKEEAALRIEEILAARRLRALELERDLAVEAGQEHVDTAQTEETMAQAVLEAAQSTEEQLRTQLRLFEERFRLQSEFLGLFAQEAQVLQEQQTAIENILSTQSDLIDQLERDRLAAIQRINDELERQRKKLLEPLERALKLMQLQQEELKSLLTIAKARHTLASEDSTEFEKQTAHLVLQEELVKRLAREREFVKLGGTLEDLQRLRDVNIVLEDILGKKKGKDDDNPLGGLVDSLDLLAKHDPVKTLREFEEAMERTRARFAAMGEGINASLEKLNSSLPTFLRFRTETGETAPLVRILESAFVGLATSFVFNKIVGSISKLTGLFVGFGGSLRSTATIVTKTAGSFRGLIGFFTGIITRLVTGFLAFTHISGALRGLTGLFARIVGRLGIVSVAFGKIFGVFGGFGKLLARFSKGLGIFGTATTFAFGGISNIFRGLLGIFPLIVRNLGVIGFAISAFAAAWTSNWFGVREKTQAALDALQRGIAAFRAGFATEGNIIDQISGGLRAAILAMLPEGLNADAFLESFDNVSTVLSDTFDRISTFLTGLPWEEWIATATGWLNHFALVAQDVLENGFDSELLQADLNAILGRIISWITIVSTNLWELTRDEWAPALFEWIRLTTPIAIAKLGEWISAILAWIGEQVQPLYDRFINEWGPALWEWIETSVPIALRKLVEWLASTIGWITGEGLLHFTEAALNFSAAFLEWLGPVVAITIVKLGEWLAAAIRWIIFEGIPGLFDTSQGFGESLTDPIAESDVKGALERFLNAVRDFIFVYVIPALFSIGVSLGEELRAGLEDKFGKMDFVTINAFLTEKLKELGKSILDGFLAGVNEGYDSTIGAFVEKMKDPIKAIKESWGISSPSRVAAEELGAPFAEGILGGISGILNPTRIAQLFGRFFNRIVSTFTGVNKDASEESEDLSDNTIGAFDLLQSGAVEIVDKMSSVLASAFRTLKETLTGIADDIHEDVEGVFDSLSSALLSIIRDLADDLGIDWNDLRTALLLTSADMAVQMLEGFDGLRTALFTLFDAVVLGVLGRIDDMRILAGQILATMSEEILGEVDDLLTELISAEMEQSWEDAGESLGDAFATAIVDTIGDRIDDIARQASAAVTAAIEAAKTAAGISSPSKVSRKEIGIPLAEGFIEGMMDRLSAVQAAANSLSMRAMQGLTLGSLETVAAPLASRPSQTIYGSTTNVNSQREYHLHLNTSQSSDVVQRNFAIMEVLAS